MEGLLGGPSCPLLAKMRHVQGQCTNSDFGDLNALPLQPPDKLALEVIPPHGRGNASSCIFTNFMGAERNTTPLFEICVLRDTSRPPPST